MKFPFLVLFLFLRSHFRLHYAQIILTALLACPLPFSFTLTLTVQIFSLAAATAETLIANSVGQVLSEK